MFYKKKALKNRDIFDVWFFFHNEWPINKKIVEKRAKMSFKDFLQECIDALEKLSNRGILSGIGELINEKQKNWARKKLKSEVIFQLKLRMENESGVSYVRSET